MPGTNSVSGLMSGLDTNKIVDQLIELESYPLHLLETKKELEQQKQDAWRSINVKLLDFKLKSYALSRPALYKSYSVTSTDESVATATAYSTAVTGNYSITVKSLAKAHQVISQGIIDKDSAIGSGTLTIKFGGGYLDKDTSIEFINSQSGISRGSVKIIDKSGASSVIDLSMATSINDVLEAINNDADIHVSIAVSGDKLVLTDTSGGSGALQVQEVGGGSTAESLGILGSTSGAAITGSDINNLASGTDLRLLNERTGIRTSSSGNDIRIVAKDGTTIDVDLSSATTLGDILDAINNDSANGGKITASIGSDGNRIVITDNTSGTGTLSVGSINGSYSAEDLGIASSVTGSSITGKALIAGLNDVLLSRFNGGDGVASGSIVITNSAGAITTIDLSSAETLQGVLDAINAAGAGVTASVNSAKDGIKLVDTAGGSGTMSVAEGGGTTASDLGILGSANSSGVLNGTDVHLQYISRATLLSDLNGGNGIDYGKIKVTDRAGNVASIDLSDDDTIKTIGDVIDTINAASGVSLLARVNDNGDGLILIDLSGDEESNLKVEEMNGGTTAEDLNIKSSTSTQQKKHGDDLAYLSGATLLSRLNDGLGVSLGRIKITDRSGTSASIDLTSATTVQDVLDAINGASIGITATIDSTGNSINLVDTTGEGDPIYVTEIDSTTADGLGILNSSGIDSAQLAGENILSPVNDRQLAFLNGQSGISGTWFQIRDKSGTIASIDVSSARTVQEVIDIINNTSALRVSASVNSAGTGLLITDTSGAGGQLWITDGDGAANSLGILGATSGATISGSAILYFATSSSLSYVLDGAGVNNASGLDDIRIIAKDGTTIDVNIDGSSTIGDVISAINTDADNAGKITASLSSDGLHLVITDNTGGAGTLSVVSINSSNTAEDLGIASSTVSGSVITGEALTSLLGDRALNAVNNFGGITTGSFTITDRSGAVATISILSSDRFLSDIVDKINAAGIGVSASIDSNGAGLVIKDTTGAEGKLYIQDNAVSQSLGIEESSGISNTSYDGANKVEISVSSTDDLDDLVALINDASDKVSAYVLNDGSGINPYRLVITSKYEGSLGRIIVDSRLNGDKLSFSDSVEADDAVVFVGDDSNSGLVVTSHSNTVKGAITGLSISLLSESDDPITLKVDRDLEEIKTAVQDFVDGFNSIMDYIDGLIEYDAETGESGILLGSVSIMTLQTQLFNMVNSAVDGLPSTMNHISAIGISMDSSGKLELDESTLEEKLLDDADAVERLFNYEVNMASADNGGSASASSSYTGFNPADAINENTDDEEFGAGVNGWQNAIQNESNAWFEVDFSQKISLYKVTLNTLSESSKKLSGYTLQYWYNDSWNDYMTVSGNTDEQIYHYFTLPYYTDKIRFYNLSGADGYSRIVDVQATEARGVGLRINGRLGYLTDPEVGLISSEIDATQDNMDLFDEQIESLQARLDKRKEFLYSQFTQMESLMGQMNSMSSWLGQQIASLPSSSKK